MENHSDLGGVFLADTSVKRLDTELRVTLFNEIAVKSFNPFVKRDIDFEGDDCRNSYGA